MNTAPLRVAVVDDDTIVRRGLPLLLPDHRVVAVYPRVEPLLDDRPDVDVVLVDLHLTADEPVARGTAAVRAVTDAGYPVLVYTNEQRLLVLAACIAAGARGVAHKTDDLDTLSEAIRAVHAGRFTVTPALVGLAELVERRGDLPTLTARQQQVLSGRARGEPFRRIARTLGISEKMAHEHMGEVTRKFARYLRDHSPADLEHHLGIGLHDLVTPGPVVTSPTGHLSRSSPR